MNIDDKNKKNNDTDINDSPGDTAISEVDTDVPEAGSTGDTATEIPTGTDNTAVVSSAPEKPGKTIISEIFDYMEIFVFSVCAVILIFTFAFRLCRVDGPSMNNTLAENDVLIATNLFYSPKQFDIIVFHQTSDTVYPYDLNKPIVKRVIATAGQYVKIDYAAGLVYVSDDDAFDESEIIDESDYVFLDGGTWKNYSGILVTYVEEGHVFVLGDNRNHSDDSRNSKIGLVDVRRIFGKVLFRVYPLPDSGGVD